MVKLTKIYTRGGDKGQTSLGDGQRVSKNALRVSAYGTVDEANAVLGILRTLLDPESDASYDAMLSRIQNEMFDLGADLCTPVKADEDPAMVLRVTPDQVKRLEDEIDEMNADLEPLTSFTLPGGTPAAAHMHLARTVVRRAERLIAELAEQEAINEAALHYANRLSDFLFVMSRHHNLKNGGDVLWVPGKTRS